LRPKRGKEAERSFEYRSRNNPSRILVGEQDAQVLNGRDHYDLLARLEGMLFGLERLLVLIMMGD
jgi:hypothetical protein